MRLQAKSRRLAFGGQSFISSSVARANYGPEVEPAVWAWANFGGLGGRTRRGCGAVMCQTFVPPSANHFQEWLTSTATRYGLA